MVYKSPKNRRSRCSWLVMCMISWQISSHILEVWIVMLLYISNAANVYILQFLVRPGRTFLTSTDWIFTARCIKSLDRQPGGKQNPWRGNHFLLSTSQFATSADYPSPKEESRTKTVCRQFHNCCNSSQPNYVFFQKKLLHANMVLSKLRRNLKAQHPFYAEKFSFEIIIRGS